MGRENEKEMGDYNGLSVFYKSSSNAAAAATAKIFQNLCPNQSSVMIKVLAKIQGKKKHIAQCIETETQTRTLRTVYIISGNTKWLLLNNHFHLEMKLYTKYILRVYQYSNGYI